jgi:VIT1/CCC1 family predicted Fe2+/Mn2+ transporter
VLTFVALAIVGILRAAVTDETWWGSALEMLGLGIIVAVVAYFSGLLVSRLGAAG